MPYYGIDAEMQEEYGQSPDEIGAYEAAEATVEFAKLSELAGVVHAALVEKGFQTVRVKYDGGYDEGFSYFDFAAVNGVRFVLEELVELLKSRPLESEPKDNSYRNDLPPRYRQECESRWANLTIEQRWNQTLENFALELANKLLYEGFGTGDATIRGQFQADLQTGVLCDLQDEEC